jgi:hypothetical protein
LSSIEHRLYDIELYQNYEVVDRKIILTTPERITWYALQGYQIFDYSQKLEMESEFFDTEQETVIIDKQQPVV